MKKNVIVILAIVLGFAILVTGMVMGCVAYTKVCVQINTETVTQSVNREWMDRIEAKENDARREMEEYLEGIDDETLLNEYVYETYGAGWYGVVTYEFSHITLYEVHYNGKMVYDALGFYGRQELIDAIIAAREAH